jgi:flagellar export protein FliJ
MKHREQVERMQQLKLAEANRARNERAGALGASEGAKAEFLETALPRGPLDPGVMAASDAYAVRLGREIEARSAALRHSDDRVEEERLLLLERRRDAEAIGALLERRVAEERLQAARREMKRLDEQATVRWGRRMASASLTEVGHESSW